MNFYTDKTILSLLRSDNQDDYLRALKYLYARLYPVIEDFIFSNSGGKKDAEDVFQDAMLVFFDKVRSDRLNLTTSIRGYLYSVCRNLWLRKLRMQKKEVRLSEEHQDVPEELDLLEEMIRDEKSMAMANLVARLGRGCQQLLRYFYYERLKMKEIAGKMGFSNEQVAKNRKSKCIKKLKKLAGKDPLLREFFTKE